MRILVVDDEKDVQPLFEQKFRKEIKARKIALAFATSGTEAIDYLNEHGDTPLVLSDINMPGMSGLELLRRIKQDHNVIPPPKVVMITAYGDDENYQLAKRLGADEFLTKPLDFNLLKEKLQIDFSKDV